MPHDCGNIRTIARALKLASYSERAHNAKRQWLILWSAQYNEKVVERYLTTDGTVSKNQEQYYTKYSIFVGMLKCQF